MIKTTNMPYYIVAFGMVMLASYFANTIKSSFETRSEKDEYELIRNFLLNETPLYGYNKPKLWIHTKYEINARRWKSFYSRNTTDLNETYIHLTVKTIMNHCGEDFHICLIDDKTFSKLIPSWDVDVSTVAEPLKSRYRELGLAKLVYYYGGMVLPNSFVCLKNLKDLYDKGTEGDKPFVCEKLTRALHKQVITPNTYIFGSPKNNEVIKEYCEYLKTLYFENEAELLDMSSSWCKKRIEAKEMNLIDGTLVGVKTAKNKPIYLDDLFEENFIDLHKDAFGIYINNEEILSRYRFMWFVSMTIEELFERSNAIIVKHIKSSILETTINAPKEKFITI